MRSSKAHLYQHPQTAHKYGPLKAIKHFLFEVNMGVEVVRKGQFSSVFHNALRHDIRDFA